MTAVWIVLLILLVATFASLLLAPGEDPPDTADAYRRALAVEASFVGSGMLKMSQPLARSSYLRDQVRSPVWRALEERVIASGLYGGSIEVFLSYQAMSIIVGIALLLGALASSGSPMLRLAITGMGAAIALLPYNKVATTVRKRAEAVGEALPEFVELLQMPLGSGMSVKQALAFTATHTEGVVSQEARWLVDSLAQPTKPEAEYFREAGMRLGTPEASAFFNALGQAHVEGVKVMASLNRQAEALRTIAYQHRRKKIRVLPVTLIVAFAIHFLPFIFIITLLPLLGGLTNLS